MKAPSGSGADAVVEKPFLGPWFDQLLFLDGNSQLQSISESLQVVGSKYNNLDTSNRECGSQQHIHQESFKAYESDGLEEVSWVTFLSKAIFMIFSTVFKFLFLCSIVGKKVDLKSLLLKKSMYSSFQIVLNNNYLGSACFMADTLENNLSSQEALSPLQLCQICHPKQQPRM